MANRYWVGGSATWDGTAGTKWATTGGGAGGSAVPTAADDVFFDASSTGTCTLSSSSVARSLNCTGFTGTLSHPTATTLNIGDATAGASNVALSWPSSMTYTAADSSAVIAFVSTSATVQTVSFGKTSSSVTYNGTGSWQLTAAHTTTTSATVNLTKGTLDTNNLNHSWGIFTSPGTLTAVLTLGSSTITMTNSTGWNVSTGTRVGLTINAGTSTITSSVTTFAFSGADKTYNNITRTGAGTYTTSGAFTCANFSVTPGAGNSMSWQINNNIVVTGLLTATGVDSGTTTGQIEIGAGVPGVSAVFRTITAASVALTNVSFANVIAAGAAAPFTGTRIGDAGGNTNITGAAPKTRYWVGNGGAWNTLAKWSATSGGAGSAGPPLPQDAVIFDANSITSASQTIVFGGVRWACKDLDFSAVLNNPILSVGSFNAGICGSLTLKSGMTTNSTTTTSLTLLGVGTHTITSAGVTIGFNVQINGAGTFTLQDNMSFGVTNTLTHTYGTFDHNGFNISVGLFSGTATNVRTWTLGTGTLSLTGTGFILNVSDVNLTLNYAGSTVSITDTSATAKTFNMPNSRALNNVAIAGGAGTITMEYAGVSAGHIGTINNLAITAPASIIWVAGQTTTFITNLAATGSAGNLITFTSSTPGTAYTLKKTSGVVSCDYLSLTDSSATGGASWYAGNNSTNVSGNTGWFFTPPVSGGVMAFFR